MKKLIIFLLIAAPFVLDAQMTYVPDDNFEQALIDMGLDTLPLNDSVLTKNIDNIFILDVAAKGISNLTGIEDFITLIWLNCAENVLTNLDVSKNINLEELECSTNQLTSLDFSKNTKLNKLICTYNKLTDLDISYNTALRDLFCFDNLLKSLDISKNIDLSYLDCGNNKLINLDVSKNIALEVLYCNENQISDLDVSKNTYLDELDCSSNKLTSLDVSKNNVLSRLICNNNILTTLDVSKNSVLQVLVCNQNNLDLLNMKNGNNINMNTEFFDIFDARNNPNLICIQVDDSTFSATDSTWFIDYWAHYSTDCGYTAINDFKFDNKAVSVIPNPATDFIEINNVIPAEAGILNNSVKIYNFLGEIVSGLDTPPYPLFLEGGKMRLDVSGLAAGVYFVRLGDSVQRFVKY